MEALSAGLLAGSLLRSIVIGDTSSVLSLLIPTIYYNYQFFKKIFKQIKDGRKKI